MEATDRQGMREITNMWWLFLVTGVLWLLVSIMILRFDLTSVSAVGVLLGVILIMAGVNEFMVFGIRDLGWKWLHALLGVFFVAGGIWAFVHPIGAFYELASILGFLLVLKGSMDIVSSVIQRQVSELWWLGLITGVVELLLGFWASQQFFAPRAILILTWIGFAAMFRGIGEIVLAFELRGAGRRMDRGAVVV